MTRHLRGNWEKEIENAKIIGMKYMVNAILDPDERKTFDDWKRLAELFNKAGEQTQKAGIQSATTTITSNFKSSAAPSFMTTCSKLWIRNW